MFKKNDLIIQSCPTSILSSSKLALHAPVLLWVPDSLPLPVSHRHQWGPVGSAAGIRKDIWLPVRHCSDLASARARPPCLAGWKTRGWAPTKQPRCRLEPHGKWAWGQGGQHSRGEGVQATGFHLQQAVPPVSLGHPKIVHRAPEDPEGGVLQHKVLALGVQPGLPASPPGRQQMVPVQPAKKERHPGGPEAHLQQPAGAPQGQASSPPPRALSIFFSGGPVSRAFRKSSHPPP